VQLNTKITVYFLCKVKNSFIRTKMLRTEQQHQPPKQFPADEILMYQV